MVDRGATILRYALAALLCAPFACGDNNLDHPGDARVLDVACGKDPGCTFTGDGKRVSGLTADSTGLRLGPSDATVTFTVPSLSLPSDDDTWTYQILARGTGTFNLPVCDGADCITAGAPTATFDWISIGPRGVLDRSVAGRLTPPQALTLHVAANSTLEIVDVRIVSSLQSTGCGG